MLLYRFTLPEEETCTETELYYRVGTGNVAQSGDTLELTSGATVSFDTYFNCFSSGKYREYTSVRDVTVSVRAAGHLTASLWACRSGAEGIALELLEQRESQSESPCDIALTAPLGDKASRLSELYFLRIDALADSVLYSARWEAPNVSPRTVRLALNTCSYRKEAYICRNAARLGRYLERPGLEKFRDNVAMLIIDNGQTLKRDQLSCPQARLYYNKNLGGCGGFTRGLMEALQSPEGFTHVCFMDDDIQFEPEVLYRTWSFLRVAAEEHLSIGGAMLELDQPWLQYEMGGVWNGRQVVTLRTGLDVRKVDALLENESGPPSHYNAWWYMCIPLALVKKHGLPFPLFIRGDDMEYGLRIIEEHSLALMNGIAVWHEGFGGKYNGALEYYVKRNEAILNVFHRSDRGPWIQIRKLLSAGGKQVVLQRYFVVDFLLRAFEDFLAGPDFFLQTDAALLHRQLMSMNPPQLDDAALAARLAEEYPGINFAEDAPEPSTIWQRLSLYSYLIPRRFYNKKATHRVVNMLNCRPEDLFGAVCVVHRNPRTGTSFITTLRKREAWRFLFRFLRISALLLVRYRRVAAAYRQRKSELTSHAFWVRCLGLEVPPAEL